MEAFFGLGSNLGDRWAYLAGGVGGLEELDPALSVSPIYETEPVGGPSGQGPYLNCVVRASVEVAPRELLASARAIEERAGRVRTVRFGPRTLDVDVLYVEGVRVDDDDLVVPHPRLYERAFVLVPLATLAPGLVAGHLDGLDTTGVRRVGELVRSPRPAGRSATKGRPPAGQR